MDADIKIGGYENIYVDCPFCGKENIYNRISDNVGDDISFKKNISCQYCLEPFSISGDEVVFGRWNWLINDLDRLKKNKEYRLYILNLCQACENFFMQAITNKLVDRNPEIRTNGYISSELWNKKYNELFTSKFKKATFTPLRTRFLDEFNEEKEKNNGNLHKMKYDKREECFECIKDTIIGDIRNNVIHKYMYRPSLKEIESFEKLKNSVIWLQRYLDVRDSQSVLCRTNL